MLINDLYGLILSGGTSSRMGKDKALITYHHAKPQREYLAEEMRKCCAKVFTSCREEQEVPPDLNALPDKFDFRGPMNGMLSAFEVYPDKAWLVIAVDMPYIDEAALRVLINKRNPQMMATCFFNPERNLPEPLLTIWEPASFEMLKQRAMKGLMSPQAFLKEAAVQLVTVPDKRILINVNTPGDWPGIS